MVERNHEIEQIYMQQLKNIESAIYVLRAKKNSYERNLQSLRMPISDPVELEKPKTNKEELLRIFWMPPLIGVGLLIVGTILLWFAKMFFWTGGIFSDICEKIGDWIDDNFWGIVVGTAIIVFFLLLIGLIYEFVADNRLSKINYIKKVESNIRIRKKNELKRKQNASLAKQREDQLARIKEELQRALTVRDSLYSVNWIPINYRNIRVAYYISDMVMSSAITVEEALKYYLLQEVNNKLDEVLRKLDEVIANQN